MMHRTLLLLAFFAMSLGARAQDGPDNFHATMGAWAAGADGSIGRQPVRADVSSDPGDDVGLYTQLDWAAPDGPLGFLANVYVINADTTGTISGSPATLDVENTILDVAFSYDLGRPENRFDVFAGIRHWDLDVIGNATGLGPQAFGDSWSDFLLGMSYAPRIGHAWWLELRLDYSGGNSEGTWGALAALQWRFRESVGLVFGWKHLDLDVVKGGSGTRFEAQLELSGPVLALEVGF